MSYQAVPFPPQRPTSTRGPKTLTFSGIGVALLGAVTLTVGIFALISVVPTGVISGTGSPGSDVVATGEAPGTFTLTSDGATAYTLWQVTSRKTGNLTARDVTITAPGGKDVIPRPPAVSGNSHRNQWSASSFAEFRAAEPGTYTIRVTPAGPTTTADVHVTVAIEFGSFMKGVFGTVGLFILGIGVGIVGFILAIAGAIWWGMRSRNAKQGTPMPMG